MNQISNIKDIRLSESFFRWYTSLELRHKKTVYYWLLIKSLNRTNFSRFDYKEFGFEKIRTFDKYIRYGIEMNLFYKNADKIYHVSIENMCKSNNIKLDKQFLITSDLLKTYKKFSHGITTSILIDENIRKQNIAIATKTGLNKKVKENSSKINDFRKNLVISTSIDSRKVCIKFKIHKNKLYILEDAVVHNENNNYFIGTPYKYNKNNEDSLICRNITEFYIIGRLEGNKIIKEANPRKLTLDDFGLTEKSKVKKECRDGVAFRYVGHSNTVITNYYIKKNSAGIKKLHILAYRNIDSSGKFTSEEKEFRGNKDGFKSDSREIVIIGEWRGGELIMRQNDQSEISSFSGFNGMRLTGLQDIETKSKLSLRTIAKILNVSLGTAAKRVQDAKEYGLIYKSTTKKVKNANGMYSCFVYRTTGSTNSISKQRIK